MTNTEELYIERQSDINCKFIESRTSKQYWYIGVMFDGDDYYWVMYDRTNGLHLLSCVGSIEGHGYEKMNTYD